jgi:hypothetical protein
MKRRRTPPEKKALSYVRDRISHGAKARHTFRKAWPRKKAAAQRGYRRRLLAEADALVRGSDPEATTTAPQVRRRYVRKWPAPTLLEWIQDRQQKRLEAHGAKARRGLRQRKLLESECDQMKPGPELRLKTLRDRESDDRARETRRRRTKR